MEIEKPKKGVSIGDYVSLTVQRMFISSDFEIFIGDRKGRKMFGYLKWFQPNLLFREFSRQFVRIEKSEENLLLLIQCIQWKELEVVRKSRCKGQVLQG